MKKAVKSLCSVVLSVCLVTTMFLSVFPLSSASETADIPTLYASAFEGETSFLTLDQYTGLGFTLGSAAAADRNPDAHPLSDSDMTLEAVTYGWTNPQALAVMLSSPYWDELNYGADMNAAGSTAFSVSTGVQTDGSATVDLEIGLSISASVSAEVFGNGGEIGGELKTALSQAIEVQSSKATETTLEYQAGAGEDRVALVVFPMASYKYSYENSAGETEYLCVNMHLEPVGTVTTLENYNRVLLEHNAAQTSDDKKLPMIDMSYIHAQYTAGDPSTGFLSASDIPECLLFENGKLIAADQTIAPEQNRLVGDVYVSPQAYSVTVGNADSGAESSLTVSSSNGHSYGLGCSLDSSVYGEISEGVDVGVAEFSASQRLTLSGSIGAGFARAKFNTDSMSYSMGFIDLPATAQTGVTGAGIPKSDYAFNAKLAVWMPREVGSKVPCAPAIIGSIVEFTDPDAMPLYLPDDLHVSQVTASAVSLAWRNPDFTEEPFSKRKPSFYDIVAVTSGSGTPTYTTVGTVSADEESYTVTGLLPATTYTYLLRAGDDSGRHSAFGPSVTVDTNSADAPIITKQPVDTVFAVGDQPIFSIDVQKTNESNTLSYNWYILSRTRYGSSWRFVRQTADNTFNAAYFDANGVITPSNRFDLDETVYRCVVVENRGGTTVSVTSDAVTLSVVTTFRIKTYDELRDVALKIRQGSQTAAAGDYVLEADITCPTDEMWSVPIGTAATPFCGTFDGQGHTIRGLTWNVSGQKDYGMFGHIRSATVKNLHLKDVNSYILGGYAGAISGYAVDSVISDCTVSGSVTGASGMGGGYGLAGICAQSAGNTVIERCVNRATVSGQVSYVGGIVAFQHSGTVVDCANHGSLKVSCPVDEDHSTMRAYAGGLVGYAKGSVQNCFNTYTLSYSTVDPEHDNLSNNNEATNSYYVNNIDNGVGGRVKERFTSGEIAHLLNGGIEDGTQSWFQNLDNGMTADEYPTLVNNGDNTVYRHSENNAYSNYPPTVGTASLHYGDLRSYSLREDHSAAITVGNARIDNRNKIITLYVLKNAKRIGLLKHLGKNGTRGTLTLQGNYPTLKKSLKQVLLDGDIEPAVYTDGNGCIFIRLPEDGRTLADLTVLFTAANKRSTAYTLRVECVDEEALKDLGITALDPLHESDPDYAVEQQPEATSTTTTTASTTTTTANVPVSPETGDSTQPLVWILIACAALLVITICATRKQIRE